MFGPFLVHKPDLRPSPFQNKPGGKGGELLWDSFAGGRISPPIGNSKAPTCLTHTTTRKPMPCSELERFANQTATENALVHNIRKRKEIILRSNSPWGFYPFQPPDSPKGQVARVSGELPPCMTRGSPLRPLGCLT